MIGKVSGEQHRDRSGRSPPNSRVHLPALAINASVVGLAYGHRGFSQLVEGAPDRLIEGGHVNERRLRAETITPSELEAAARRQGFASLQDVDQAIPYPCGTFCFIGKVPTAEAAHHHQIMKELHELKREWRA